MGDLCISPLESREVHERRGRCKPFGAAASSGFRDASPVADTTDPPQAEGNILLLSSGESQGTLAEAVASRLAMRRQTILEAPPQSLTRLTLRKRSET